MLDDQPQRRIVEVPQIQAVNLGQLKPDFTEIALGNQDPYDTRRGILAKIQELGLSGLRIVTQEQVLAEDEVMLIIGGVPPTVLRLTTANQIEEVPIEE